jgi:UDP-N-acetylmuramoyl-tripeptide--D-alanyl-D-alanine ligase
MHHPPIEYLYRLFLEANQCVCTDTRKIEKGAIFFALRGDNFNANEFASQAIEKGCAYAVIDDEAFYVEGKTILVTNVLETLQTLANFHRNQLNIPILAITGSNGKTTSKELLAAVLSKKYNTLATFGNLNNHIGVPLTLLSISPQHQFAIIEMGANHQGEIETLCRIANPNFGIITNIGKAHLEGFGGIEGVKKGKSEMYRFLQHKQGLLFVNADDDVLMQLSDGMKKYCYGFKETNDMQGKDVSQQDTVAFKFKGKDNSAAWDSVPTVQTQIVGHYNLINCLAACCIGKYFGVSDDQIAQALSAYTPNMNRSQLVKTAYNTIILDAYNANPNSMRAAIENFAKIKANQKLLLLGDMFELGDYAAQEHQTVVDLLTVKQFTNVVLVGPNFKKTNGHAFKTFEDTEACMAYLNQHSFQNYYVLIKGSRGMKMETLQSNL